MSLSSLGVRAARASAIASVVLGACNPLGDKSLLEIEAVGSVGGFVFIDLNGTEAADAGDDGVEGWTIRLAQPGGGVIGSAVTDVDGNFEFGDVPVGDLVVGMDPSLFGDTLDLLESDLEPTTLALADVAFLTLGLTYPKVTVAEARAYALGKPLFTTGVALNAVNQNVSVLHVQDIQGGGRVIRVRDLVGQMVAEGDSVRVRGRTTRSAGQPILEMGRAFLLGRSTALIEPVEVSSSQASTADGGALDGALVQVRNAEILEVEDLDEDGIRLVVDDGSGSVEVRLRLFLGANPGDFDPALVMVTRVRGLLVATDDGGGTRWILQPRTRTDYRVDPKVP